MGRKTKLGLSLHWGLLLTLALCGSQTGCDWSALEEALNQAVEQKGNPDAARRILGNEVKRQATETVIQEMAPRLIPSFASLASTGGMEKDFLEFTAEEPRPYAPVGVPDLDEFGHSVYLTAKACHENAISYIHSCDQHRVWAAFSNDVGRCVEADGLDRDACAYRITGALSAEDHAALAAFKRDHATTVDAQVRMLSGCVEISQTAERFYDNLIPSGTTSERGAEAVMQRIGAIGQICEHCRRIKAGLNYYNHQKKIMNYLETNTGR